MTENQAVLFTALGGGVIDFRFTSHSFLWLLNEVKFALAWNTNTQNGGC